MRRGDLCAILDRAAERGVTFLDTADAYPIPPDPETAGRTEEVLGDWLASGKGRDQFVVATKCRIRVGPGPNDAGLSRRHILAACEASLRRLQTDHIDLYQAHLPDPETPLDETLRAFDDLVRAGKVRYVGCSNYPAWQLALALGLSASGTAGRGTTASSPATTSCSARSRRNCCPSAATRGSA